MHDTQLFFLHTCIFLHTVATFLSVLGGNGLFGIVFLGAPLGDIALVATLALGFVRTEFVLFFLFFVLNYFCFFSETHHDDIGLLDQCPRADGIDAGALAVMPERVVLGAQDIDAAIIAAGVVGDGRGEPDIQARGRCALDDLLTPVGVDFPREIDCPV